ncbi:MAG: hypothetical protein KAQ69_11535 [Spirochaetales bacterium]|nr:hypothetical protein [Spirochaetales bacterium]
MKYNPVVLGYHANYKGRCECFLDGGIDLIEDEHWLGNGMYFWDNKSNMQYWVKLKRDCWHKIDDNIIMVSAMINLTYVLDLTDKNTMKVLQKVWSQAVKMKKKLHNGVPIHDEMGVGLKVEYVLSTHEKLGHLKVVKGIGEYSKKVEEVKFLRTERPAPKITGNVKTMYSVRCSSVILDREVLAEEKRIIK